MSVSIRRHAAEVVRYPHPVVREWWCPFPSRRLFTNCRPGGPQGRRTINELAWHYGVHPTLIHGWKKQLLTGAEGVFASGAKATGPPEDQTAELFEQIGRLKVELEWVKKKAAAFI